MHKRGWRCSLSRYNLGANSITINLMNTNDMCDKNNNFIQLTYRTGSSIRRESANCIKYFSQYF